MKKQKHDKKYQIPLNRFNNPRWIEKRLKNVNIHDYHAIQKIFRYLYQDDASMNLSRVILKKAEKYLDKAEKIVARWLITRTNGRVRKNYGPIAGKEARKSRYRCRDCGFPDVRALELDHVGGRKNAVKRFRCLCANCHMIVSRKRDWQRPQ